MFSGLAGRGGARPWGCECAPVLFMPPDTVLLVLPARAPKTHLLADADHAPCTPPRRRPSDLLKLSTPYAPSAPNINIPHAQRAQRRPHQTSQVPQRNAADQLLARSAAAGFEPRIMPHPALRVADHTVTGPCPRAARGTAAMIFQRHRQTPTIHAETQWQGAVHTGRALRAEACRADMGENSAEQGQRAV